MTACQLARRVLSRVCGIQAEKLRDGTLSPGEREAAQQVAARFDELHLTVDDAAAVGIVEKIISFLFLVPSSMLSTVSALGAQNIGAGKYDRVDKILWYAIAIGVGFGAVMALLMQFIAPSVVRPFTSDEAVVLAGAAYIRSYIFDCLFAGIQFSFSGYFCAWGRSGLSFLHNTLSILLVRVPGAWLACRFFPQTLVPMGLAPACGSLFSSIVCVLLYRWMKRQNKPTGDKD